jgi:TPR repeat protein
MPKDEKVAKQWFKKAADQGDKESKEMLAKLDHKAPAGTPSPK